MIINTGLLAFASWRDGKQHKAAGISWQMSPDNPVADPTSCEKVDLEIQRQDLLRGLRAGFDSVICSLGGAEQHIYVFLCCFTDWL